jgi:putative membrane protein
MMWGYYDSMGWLWMAGMMLIFWGGVAALIVYAIRAFAPTRGGDPALDTLRKRLAGGEISQEEFEKTRKALQG